VDGCKPLAVGHHRLLLHVFLQRGEAVQLDPIKHTLKAPGNKRLKLKHDELLSMFGFKFNLRPYYVVVCNDGHVAPFYENPLVGGDKNSMLGACAFAHNGEHVRGRGLHSSTFRLNVSTFCVIRRVHDFPPVY